MCVLFVSAAIEFSSSLFLTVLALWPRLPHTEHFWSAQLLFQWPIDSALLEALDWLSQVSVAHVVSLPRVGIRAIGTGVCIISLIHVSGIVLKVLLYLCHGGCSVLIPVIKVYSVGRPVWGARVGVDSQVCSSPFIPWSTHIIRDVFTIQ